MGIATVLARTEGVFHLEIQQFSVRNNGLPPGRETSESGLSSGGRTSDHLWTRDSRKLDECHAQRSPGDSPLGIPGRIQCPVV